MTRTIAFGVPARSDEIVGAASTTCSKLSSEDEQPLVRDVLDQPVVGADRGSDRALDEGGVAERLQRNPEDTVGELLDRLGRELEREPRLAASAGARERDQPMLAKELTCLLELALPPDERGRLNREVRPVEGLERREVPVAELVQALRAREVLEPVVAEVAEPRFARREAVCRLREENLPAVARAHDPRRPVHVGTDVTLVRDDRLTGVDADPDSHRPSFERGLTVSSGGDRIGRACEREKNASPWVSTSTPPCRANASRSSRRCSASTSA